MTVDPNFVLLFTLPFLGVLIGLIFYWAFHMFVEMFEGFRGG